MSAFPLKIFCLMASYLTIYKEYCDQNQAINISQYNYPSANETYDEYYRIAIFGTNDIHGSAFPLEITHPVRTNTTYKYGGLEYMARYLQILRKEWGDRLLWLDGGDQFQGGIESKLSNGSIMTEFFNAVKLNGSAIGNHEWDYGQPYLYQRLEKADWNYLAANIVSNTTGQQEFLPNTKVGKMFQVGKIKVGVIGLSTIETPYTTSGDLTNVKFVEYRNIVIEQSNLLKQKGANIIILNTHVGLICKNDKVEKMVLNIRDSNSTQGLCLQDDEISTLLNGLAEGVVDAVVAGHRHDIVHHWINGIPVIQNINGGYYSHVMYLSFEKSTMKLKREKIQIEGPLPSCEKVFTNTKKCNYITKTEAKDAGELTSFSFHNELMKPDTDLSSIFSKWWDTIKPYKENIGYTEELLVRNADGENVLGNFVCDFMQNLTQSQICINNDGSMRSTWFPGDIQVENVYNMFPFDNFVVSFEMTGEELKKMFKIMQGGKKSFYHSSGVLMNVTDSPKALLNVKLYDGTEIDDAKVYTVSTNDFILGGGDDFKDVASWYKTKNRKEHGGLRENFINYLRNKKYIRREELIIADKRRINILKKASLRKGLE